MDIQNLSNITLPQYAGSGTQKALSFVGQISEWIKSKIGEAGIVYNNLFSTILTIFISLLILFVAMKVGNRIIKIILYILGVVLLIGTIYTIFTT